MSSDTQPETGSSKRSRKSPLSAIISKQTGSSSSGKFTMKWGSANTEKENKITSNIYYFKGKIKTVTEIELPDWETIWKKKKSKKKLTKS